MSKYHIRDKFVIEIDEVFENDADDFIHEEKLYRIKGFNSLVFDDNGLDKLQKYETFTVRPDAWDESLKEQYNKGLEDAWELAQRITKYSNEGGMTEKEMEEVFKYANCYQVMRLSYQEALAKLEAYEKEQEEIKVGDVFEFNHSRCCVVKVSEDNAKVLWKSGNTAEGQLDFIKKQKKIKHIDLTDLFKQIGGGER